MRRVIMRYHIYEKLTAWLLILAMVFTLLPSKTFASASTSLEGYEPTKESISISAESEHTVTVVKREEDLEETDDILKIENKKFQIIRDYEQQCLLQVTNISNETQEFYLEAENKFDDLALEIIKSGSKDNPTILKPGESTIVELSVFAQNATQERYTVPIVGYLFQNGTYIQKIKKSVTLDCSLPALNLTWTKIFEDDSTLRRKFCVENNGDTLTDLEISASDAITNYISFSPAISNFELGQGDVLEFSVQPDLAKMKQEGIRELKGSLVASCAGKTSQYDCSFDTKGQEITVTTMGQLALKQDKNPFSKFEAKQEGSSLQYFDGNQYRQAQNLSDFVDENDLIHMKSSLKLDLGVEQPLNTSITIQSSKLDNNAAEEGFQSSAKLLEDGTLRLTVRTIVSAEEYKNSIQELKNTLSGKQTLSNTLRSAPKSNTMEEAERYVLERTFDINSIAGYFDYGIDEIEVLGDIYNVCTVIEDTATTFEVLADPTLPQENKTCYALATVCKFLLLTGQYLCDAALPGSGFIFDLATRGIQKQLDELQKLFLEGKIDPATYQDILGRQCTNRGRITTSFYVPDYRAALDSKKPSMYTSSRLYADGYVNETETNYDITLNGLPAKTVNIPGLTQTVMTEIPTDGLKPGEINILDFDYDTNPGSHFVNTDTKVTFVYPKDTQIGYIGEPDTLQEVRPLPDFAVYPENIYTEDALIEGEETELKFHAYNLGSRGGWFTITAKNGDKEIFRKENYYLPAFSSETFHIQWIPYHASSDITITLTNTSIGVEELDSTNNTATKQMAVRERQVPSIKELSHTEIYEQTPFSVIVDVENCADIVDMDLSIDNKEIEKTVRVSENSDKNRYHISIKKGLELGEYQLKVSLKYKFIYGTKTINKEFPISVLEKKIIAPKASGYPSGTLLFGESFTFQVTNIENLKKTELILDNRQLIDVTQGDDQKNVRNYSVNAATLGIGKHSATIRMYYTGRNGETLFEDCSTEITVISESESYFTFTLEKDIKNPLFYIYDSSKNTCSKLVCQEITSEQSNVCTYRFMKTLHMLEHPHGYQLLIQHQSGLFVEELAKENLQVSTKNCHSIKFEMGKEAANAKVTKIQLKEIGGNPINFELPFTDTISFSPGTYLIQVSGEIGKEHFNRVIEVDVVQTDQVINLDEFVMSYYFKIKEPGIKSWSAQMHYRESDADQWNHHPMSTLYDDNTGLLKCYMADTSILKQAKETIIVVYTENEIYATPVSSSAPFKSRALDMAENTSNEPVAILDRNTLHKVTLLCKTEEMKVTAVNVSSKIFHITFGSDIVYLPDGQYNFKVVVSTSSQDISVKLEDEIRQETELIVDKKISNNLTNIKISWPTKFQNTASLYSELSSGKEISAKEFASGNSFLTESGKQSVYINLRQDNYCYSLQKDISVEGKQEEINIGELFKGSIPNTFTKNYLTDENISVSISGAKDENGNLLTKFYGEEKYFKGTMTFTDINDENKKFVLPAIAASNNLVTASLPPEEGTYRILLTLYSYVKGDIHQHSIVTDPAIAATCTKDGLTEGSHCETCGEITKKQTVIPAVGHVWDKGNITKKPTLLAEGEKTYTCTVCKTTKKKKLPKKALISISGPTEAAKGKSIKLKAALKNINGTVKWSVNPKKTATIKGNGTTATLKGKYAGTVKVTAQIGSVKATKTIRIIIPIKTIKLNKTSKSLSVGEKFQLKKTMSPKNTTQKTVTYKSSNPKVATINSSGKVTAKKQGICIITVTSRPNKKVKAKCKIIVKKPSITISGPSTVKKGKSIQLKAKLKNIKGSIKWSVNNKLASIKTKGNKVTLKAKKKTGTIKLTARVGTVKKTKTIKIKK